MTTTPSPELPDLDRLVRYDSFETDEGDELRIEPTGRWVRFDDVESLLARLAQHAESVAPAPDAERVDAIVTGLYRRFKDWSKRGFSADDVTWCEVKADVIALIAAQSQGAQTAYEELLQAARDLRGELVVANALIERRTRERDEALAAQQAAAPGALDLMNADEMAALRRFDETCQDGEGYDVPKTMMQRLAAIGVVRRTSGSYYETTEFGLRVLHQSAPSAPGTPETPAGFQLVPIKLPDAIVDQIASASYDLDDTAREIVREDWACALGMLRAAQLDGGQGEGETA
ncbi:hypothetical protein [Massilia timonae]|uniref:hypothetical protein n=1 Tax=Massilia timonae TaxID=47229 RepID=UPI000ED8A426|nr:hypothetical protein [Massilia timonae]HAK91126.1 hypothetical protein [Massilia timonae]